MVKILLWQVMELVKALTRTSNSITVCATIHSPSPQTFDLFDKVIILLAGRIVYFGNNGAPPSLFSCSAEALLPPSPCLPCYFCIMQQSVVSGACVGERKRESLSFKGTQLDA